MEGAPRGAGAGRRHVVLLFLTIVGIPWAVRQAVRWVFIPQVVVFEGLRARDALQRSAELVRGRWWRTAVLVGLLTGIGLATGLLAGLLLLFLTTAAPLSVVNFIGSLVYVVALPYVAVALALALAYGDRVARGPAPPGGAAVVEANWPFVAFRGGAAAG